MENKIIFNGVFGSHLYGTSTPESDKDYKAIFLPTFNELVSGEGIKHFSKNTSNNDAKNTSDDVDIEYYSLKYFIEMAKKGETIAVDMLHTPDNLNLEKSQIWDFIYQNRAKFYTTDMKAYLGYVKKQAAKYGIKGTRMAALRQVWDAIQYLDVVKANPGYRGFLAVKVEDIRDQLPINEYCKFSLCAKTGSEFYEVMGSKHQLTIRLAELKQKIETEWNKYGERARLAEKNEGIDWKALHHAIRGGMQLKEIYSTGDLRYPLQDAEELLRIKKGEVSFKIVSELLEDLISDVDVLSAEASKNGMQSKVDNKFWDDFIYDVNLQTLKEGILK